MPMSPPGPLSSAVTASTTPSSEWNMPAMIFLMPLPPGVVAREWGQAATQARAAGSSASGNAFTSPGMR
jgi:hypothetical protein